MRIHHLALTLALLGCGGADRPASSTAPAHAPKPPSELEVGEVAAAEAVGDVLGDRLRVSGGERFVLVLSSASLGRGEVVYEVVKEVPAALGGFSPVTGCALSAEPQVPLAADAPPEPSGKVQRGDLRRFTVRLEDGHREVS